MINIDKRIEFLIDKFDIYMGDELNDNISKLEGDGYNVVKVDAEDFNETIGMTESSNIAIIYSKFKDEDEKYKVIKSMIHEDIFANMIESDPTTNKIYLQWMLTILSKLLNENRVDDAIRFANEDLPLAKEYLTLFDANKRKKLFLKLSKNNYSLNGIKDPSNINQYKSLSQLFDSVDPFIEKSPSDLERAMLGFANSGQAEMPVKDRRFTLFIPLTRDASVLFGKFAGWCTAVAGNGMFTNYTNYKTPISPKSKIYIIIDNEFLNGKFEENSLPNEVMYQIHFESKQIRDRSNGSNKNIFENVLSKSDALSNFFYEELKPMAKSFDGPLKSNYYVDYLVDFGFPEVLFDLVDDSSPSIRFKDGFINSIPDLKRFTNLEFLLLGNVKLKELTSSIGSLSKLNILSLPDNDLTELPKEIGYCKSLVFINILNNKITKFPREIAMLDRTNGGNLHRISVRKKDIGEDNFNLLKELLPSVLLTDNM